MGVTTSAASGGHAPSAAPVVPAVAVALGTANSGDPNSLIGPAGFGPQGSSPPAQQFPYRIDFENDPTATAPAQRSTSPTSSTPTSTGPPSTHRGRLRRHDHHHPGRQPALPDHRADDLQRQDLRRPDRLGLDSLTGQVYAHFQSIDPNTQLPPDVLTGFLPPEDGTGRGMGYFSYTIQPKAGLPTGTADPQRRPDHLRRQPVIATDQVDPHDPSKGTDPAKEALITIDAGAPTSSVAAAARPTSMPTASPCSWSGRTTPAARASPPTTSTSPTTAARSRPG